MLRCSRILIRLTPVLLFAPCLWAVAGQTGNTGSTLLVDTDDACRLVIDDEDKGVITPDKSQKFKVSLGQHILKCTVESVPALAWRKIVDVKDSSQVAAVITLKALHVQYDQAVTKAKTQKDEATAAAARQLQEAEAAEKQREAARLGSSAPEKYSQYAAHFNAGRAAFAEAQDTKAQMKSASGESLLALQKNFASACDKAISELTQANDFVETADSANHANLLANIGASYLLEERYQEAIEKYEAAIGWAPDFAFYYVGLSLSRANAGRIDGAREACRIAIHHDTSTGGTCWMNLGAVLYNSGKIAESIEPLRIGASATPQNAIAWCLLGQALIRQRAVPEASDRAEAIAAFQWSLQLDQNGLSAEPSRAMLKSLNAPLNASSPLPAPTILAAAR